MRIADEDITWQEAAARWKAGDPVWSAELGGLGPGYEQAIQILLFELLVRWVDKFGNCPVGPIDRDHYPDAYEKHLHEVVRALDKSCRGFSGAQVGVAKITAYQFMTQGYSKMLSQLDFDRKIQVSRHFPTVPGDA